MKNIDPKIIEKYIGDTKGILDKQQGLFKTLKSMKPMINQVKELMGNFKDVIGGGII